MFSTQLFTDNESCPAHANCSSLSRTVLGKLPHPLLSETKTHPLLSDVYISIKSTQKYHSSRLLLLLLTWFQTVPPQNLFIVTDASDNETQLLTDYGYTVHVADHCDKSHTHGALSCKCGAEFDLFYQMRDKGNNYKWYCHFDDDMYVNVKGLTKLLEDLLDPLNEGYYLGKWSVNHNNRLPVRQSVKNYFGTMARDSYYFATGAAYCISVLLMNELEEYIRGAKLQEVSRVAGVPDDMVVGLLIEGVLGYNMTETSNMLSHLHSLRRISKKELTKQVTISYGSWNINGKEVKNIITLDDGRFTHEEDNTRFLSYHCLLWPLTPWCK